MNPYTTMIHIPQTTYIYRVSHRFLEGDCQYDHGPRVVELNSYSMGKYPVTNGMFQIFLQESGYQPSDTTNFLRHWINGTYPAKLEHHPVVWVSPTDARAYAAWAGLRLPTDAEWQYAACGPHKLTWPWGNDDQEACRNSDTTGTTPVDAYPAGASPFGCMDMSGNTWEWVNDMIDDGHHLFTFVRGGSYYSHEGDWYPDGGARPNDYHWKVPLLNEGLNRCATVGFRCASDGGQ